jgi:hypothetical protein
MFNCEPNTTAVEDLHGGSTSERTEITEMGGFSRLPDYVLNNKRLPNGAKVLFAHIVKRLDYDDISKGVCIDQGSLATLMDCSPRSIRN